MPKILMSACLLGHKVRYDGKDNLQNHERLQAWINAGDVISICPEMAGGLPTPRPPAEIQPSKTAKDVLNAHAKIITIAGDDVSKEYLLGAEKALALAEKYDIHVAILKARSPSCGSTQVYDGTHSRTLIDGMGVTAQLLSQHGIQVFDENQIDLALETASKINETKQTLVDSLLNDKRYHIEFNGHLTNHDKHAVIALYRLGASQERIKDYYDSYAKQTPYGYGLEAAKTSTHIITEENWKLFLGKRTSFSSYCDFFDRQEKKLGMKAFLQQYVPPLISGWVGSLMHGTIHLGWALDVNNRWMIIEGVAYMAFSYVSCHIERAQPDHDSKQKSVMDSLFHITETLEKEPITNHDDNTSENIHPDIKNSGFQYKIAQFLSKGHPFIYRTPIWVYNQDTNNTWQQLHYAITLLYLEKPGDFLILHLLTSLHAMEQIAQHMDFKQQQYIIQCYWIGILAILVSTENTPQTNILRALNLKYQEAFDTEYDKPKWDEVIAKALCEVEEHNPKLVYTLQRMWTSSKYQSIFRVAAFHFTTTPVIPKLNENS